MLATKIAFCDKVTFCYQPGETVMYERYDGLIFDMDGTLLDTQSAHRKAWHEVLGRYDMKFDEQVAVALNGSPTWCIAQAMIGMNQVSVDPHRLAREKSDVAKALLLEMVRPLPLIAVVKEWYGRRPMSVGTGSEGVIAEALLARFGLRRYFDAVVAAGDVKHHKPAPDTFLLCAERMGVYARKCVVFEDAEFGLQAARAAGMDAVDVRLL